MPNFQYVQATEEQIAQMQVFRDKFQELADAVAALPNSRGINIALSTLETAAFWVNKAITKNDAGLTNPAPAAPTGDAAAGSEQAAA